MTLFLVPHWSAALFVLPLISVLYIDLLGVLQWAGIAINPVSYITLVMSIGKSNARAQNDCLRRLLTIVADTLDRSFGRFHSSYSLEILRVDRNQPP